MGGEMIYDRGWEDRERKEVREWKGRGSREPT